MKQTVDPYVLSGNSDKGPHKKNVLYQAVQNTGAIDGWMCEETADGRRILWLLQHTVGISHSINIGPLVFAIKALQQGYWAQADVRLAFVVPHWRSDRYATNPQKIVFKERQVTEGDWKAASARIADETSVDAASGGALSHEAGSSHDGADQRSQEPIVAGIDSLYNPKTGKWVKDLRGECTDKNSLAAAPFTLYEAMETLYGSECGITQWVWSCIRKPDSGSEATSETGDREDEG